MVIFLLILIVYSAAIVLTNELISKRKSRKSLMLKPWFFMASVLILSDFILLFDIFINNIRISAAVILVIVSSLAVANRIKIDYRQTGFTPLDFLMLKEAGSMAGALNKRSMLKMFCTLIISVAVLGYAARLLPVMEHTFLQQVLVIGATLILLTFFYFRGPRFNQSLSVFESGIIVYFLSYLNDPPRIAVSGRKRSFDSLPPLQGNKEELPDVIVIQSESFVDPLIIGKDMFNEDPVPFFRSLQGESYSFTMATRAFGGGTVHTEFEIMTGLSTIFFPRDTTVFQRYLKNPLPSLGSILKKHDYRSLLIHPYHKWYYNRTEVYRKLGFDRFISLSSFEEKDDGYVSDKLVFNKIEKELEDGSNFIFAVTMQNHTPYTKSMGDDKLEYLGDFSTKGTRDHFNKYLNGLSETDKALRSLIDYLKTREKETILLFYGDHLPVINQDAVFYEESKWSNATFDSKEFFYDLSKSPGLIWSNRRNLIGGRSSVIDATAVLPDLLDIVGCSYPEYLKDIASIYRENGVNGLFRDYLIRNEQLHLEREPIFKKIYSTVRVLNERAFNDPEFDKWCYDNDKFKIY